MAVIFMDGFDHYNSIQQKWPYGDAYISYAISSTYTRPGFSGHGLYLNANREAAVEFSTALTSGVIGGAWRGLGNDSGQYDTPFYFNTSATFGGVRVYQYGAFDYRLRVVSSTGATLCFTTDAYHNTWYYLELKVVLGTGTSGSVELRANGITIASNSACDTGITSANYVGISGGQGNTSQAYHDDVYIADDTTFRGDCHVETLYPTADSSVQWTPGTGTTNYDLVDEPGTINEGSTDFVETSTTTNKDLYTIGDLATTSGSVYAVQSNVYARKTDAGSRTMHSIVKYSGTESNGSTINLLDTGKVYSDVFMNRPGGTGWTIAEVNAMEAGFELDT